MGRGCALGEVGREGEKERGRENGGRVSLIESLPVPIAGGESWQ
jgi:hypothetical protein